MQKKVSVIIPTYNQAKYLNAAIVSACEQTYKNIEVIIVNDGSSDDTHEIILDYRNKYANIKYLKQTNQGVAQTRNNGIKASTGYYFAFLDSDDYWELNKIEQLVNYMDKNIKVGLVHSFVQVVGASSEKISEIYYGKEGDLFIDLITFNGVNIPPPSSIIIRKEVIEKIGMFKTNFLCVEDQEFYIRVAKVFQIGCVKKVLCYYRIHKSNMHKNNIEIEKGFLKLNRIIANYKLPLKIRLKSISKLYIIIAQLRWKSDKKTYIALYYLLVSLIINPLFFTHYFYKLNRNK